LIDHNKQTIGNRRTDKPKLKRKDIRRDNFACWDLQVVPGFAVMLDQAFATLSRTPFSRIETTLKIKIRSKPIDLAR